MKAHFSTLNNIVIKAESQDEKLLLQQFRNNGTVLKLESSVKECGVEGYSSILITNNLMTDGKISREHVVENGKASFYACIYPELIKSAKSCGWALGLHGSLSSDMDIMAMPWTVDAKPVEEMIQALSDCFKDNPWKDHHIKPNNRVVYTMTIWKDFYLDINVIQLSKPEPINVKSEECC